MTGERIKLKEKLNMKSFDHTLLTIYYITLEKENSQLKEQTLKFTFQRGIIHCLCAQEAQGVILGWSVPTVQHLQVMQAAHWFVCPPKPAPWRPVNWTAVYTTGMKKNFSPAWVLMACLTRQKERRMAKCRRWVSKGIQDRWYL